MKIELSVFGEDHPDVANSYNNIGAVYYFQRNFEKSLACYEKSLKTRLAVFGENHPEVATSYYNIGLAYYAQRNYEKSLECFEATLRIRLSVSGEEHPDTIGVRNNIAEVKQKIKEIENIGMK